MSQISDSVAVVTGGAGFIGSHLCDRLVEAGNQVICVDNLDGTDGSNHNISHLLDAPQFTFAQESVVDWASPSNLDGVEYVFHQAASKNTVSLDNPVRDLEVNALGTLRLLLAAKDSGVRKFVHGSTGSVYGELQETQDEWHPKNPVSFYGVSKLAGESYCRVVGEMYDLDCTVYRYFHVIGPRQNDSDTGGVVPIFIRRCLEGEPLVIFGTGEQLRSFTSVDDVVEANLLAARLGKESNGVFNCASGIQVSIQELADFVSETMSHSGKIDYREWRLGDIINFDVDNSAIRGLGMTFDVDWKSVVRRVVGSMTP